MILDKPVKSYLMASVETALSGVSMIRQVKNGQDIPIDMDTAVYPFVAFFDEPETKGARNRVAEKTFNLVVRGWVVKTAAETIEEQMDRLDADVENKLLNDPTVNLYARKILPQRLEKFVADDEEMGMIQTVFQVTYMHAWKNAYELPTNP